MNPERDTTGQDIRPGSTGGTPGAALPGERAAELPSRPLGPAVPHLLLGMLLRHRREVRGTTRTEAGEAAGLAEASIRDLEHGRVRITIPQLLQLFRAYGIGDRSERITLLSLATLEDRPAWWEPYRDVLDDWMDGYLSAEQAAELIRIYEPQFIPSLLQTPAYARAVVRLGLGSASAREVERRVELRSRRQEILGPGSATRIWVILDETALIRSIGGPAVMFEQIDHLIDMCAHPRVTIQILPLHAASVAAVRGPMSLLRLPHDQLGDIVYLEHQTAAVFLSHPDEVLTYRYLLDRLAVHATVPAATPHELRLLLPQVDSR